MSTSCADFRALLEQALASRRRLTELARAEHPQTCALCRAELGRERALDDLLERVSEPEVPATLARRVLAGLAAARARAVSSTGDAATDDATAEDAALEELLDGLPAPRVPAGLPARVLAGVAHARPPRPRRRGPWLLLAAAGLAGLALWSWSVRRAGAPLEVALSGASEAELDAELLAYAVERWELLHDEDLDVWLASLDPLDEVLLEYAGDATWSEGSSEASAEGD
jgi:hypothetical protein